MRLQYYEAVRNVWRHRIGGDLGGTRLGEHQLHFGEFLDCLLDLALHYQGLFQTDGRHAGRGEREVLLIELRNELRAEQSEYRNRRQDKGEASEDERPRPCDRLLEQWQVAILALVGIGRAEWRVRVCEYGECWVVGVYLIKK